VRRDGRVRRRHSARCEQRGVHSNRKLGVAKLGTDGPVRRSGLVSLVWWTGPPPIPRCRPPRATNRMTRPPRRNPLGKLLADSGSEPGANASPLFKEPAARMTRHDGRGCTRVGWTIPATHAKTNSVRIEHPIRTLADRDLVTGRSNRGLCWCDSLVLQ
jgi:hypothetical protein